MVVIRLARRGSKHNPNYRITVANQRFQPAGRFIEVIGFYQPLSKNKNLVLNTEKYDKWLKKGARPSKSAANLYKRLQTGAEPKLKQQKTNRSAEKIENVNKRPETENRETSENKTEKIESLQAGLKTQKTSENKIETSESAKTQETSENGTE